MSGKMVNLDALIKRRNMDTGGDLEITSKTTEIKHTDLEEGAITYSVLCKPDFQRETASWTPEKVCDLVITYAKDFVPAIIVWRSASNDLFVIDGAHRLSSIIAWVNDDYGDGQISRAFFGDEISEDQKVAAQKTRDLINKSIGPYKSISNAFKSQPQYVETAKALNFCSLTAQQLKTRDIHQAERSFFKINEQGVSLSDTEIILLRSRECPNAIAARAINQAGTGHRHWCKFAEENKDKIEKLGAELYTHCFKPPIAGPTIKTSVLPICGRHSSSSTLEMLLNLVNMTNKVAVDSSKHKAPLEELIEKDVDGERTIEFLKNTRRTIISISNQPTSDYMKSLDLHPLIYFYSSNGRHLPSAFLATIEFIMEYMEKDKFKEFTRIREKFEDFLTEYNDFFSQIVLKTRGKMKAVHKIRDYFRLVAKECERGENAEAVVKSLQSSAEFKFLKLAAPLEGDEISTDFTPPVKSKVFLRKKLETAIRCGICRARVPDQGVSVDHDVDKKLGGKGSEENARLTHHYCNSAKDILVPYLKAERKGVEASGANTHS
ncbi:MAG TPA: DUF262 domain-containing protein [Candidatus Solibacter sp.]|nr:DUF262 domain-containing protein [Candidatus Solibacter sp.]